MQEPLNDWQEVQSTESEPKPDQVKQKKRKGLLVLLLSLLFCTVFTVLLFFNFDRLFPSRLKEPEQTQTEEGKIETTPVIPDDEIRGVYIASVLNINFPSQKGLGDEALKMELDAIVENTRDIGFDTIYFQARPSGDALYHSDIFPTSRYLTGQEGKELELDPLAYLIEKAKEYDMKVVAWVNPYRVTASTADSKEAALETLSDQNPAKLHPDWTVFYGGKLYYNPALSQVRELIASGVKEICEGYEVAGILYDDYFYPYPVKGEAFEDSAAYEDSGTELSLGDWRRENVNQMVKLSFDTVKAVSAELTFGISPFGIWKNASSDPKGSDTHGMEAYSELYCDALAWIEGGYIDYISPQIYWERGNDAADFATLTRWWSAQVDGTGVSLVISHAAYRVGEFQYGGNEIAQQIHYARNYIGSCGSIQYGYEDISKNTEGVRDAIRSVFAEAYYEENAAKEVTGVSFIRPSDGMKTTESAQFVTILSDPSSPVYSETGKVGRTKNGFISILFPLALGENTMTLTQNGVDYSLTVTRTNKNVSSSTLKKFDIAGVTPSVQDGVLASSGTEIPLTVTAPAGCSVTAKLATETVSLEPTLNPSGDGGYLKEVYEGSVSVPVIADGSEPISIGKILYTITLEDQTRQSEGAEVRVIPSGLSVIATVTNDYSHLKTAPDSSFYGDYTPASIGMQDEVISFHDGCYQLSFGGFVAAENVSIEMGGKLSDSVLTQVKSEANEKTSNFVLNFGASPALSADVKEDTVKITFFRTETDLDQKIPLAREDRLFQSVTVKADAEKHTAVLTAKLRDDGNYYGFDYTYEKGSVRLSFRQPQSLHDGEKSLTGKRIVIDAGHGGTDMGALGFYSDGNEKDLNLSIALILQDKLEELGAQVLMTRGDDSTVTLTERMNFLTASDPDLAISVHHNSANEATDANNARGTLGLYWSEAGISLASSVQASVRAALGIRDLGTRSQELALCRNHRFPQTLVETSFICSPAEYQRASRSDYAEVCAEAMKEGILDWYREQEGFLRGDAS